MKIEKFGEIVKSLRKKKNLTVAELSVLSGVPFHVLGTIERGQNWPSSQWLGQLSQALGVSVSSLFEEEGALKPVFHSRDKQGINRQLKNTMEEILASCERLEFLCGARLAPCFPLKIPFREENKTLIEDASLQARELLGVRELNSFDLISILEDQGLRIITCLFQKGHSAISCYHPRLNASLFFLNSTDPPEGKLFSLAYELGRQILMGDEIGLQGNFQDSGRTLPAEILEQFAVAFLIPEKKLKKIFNQLALHPHLLDYDLLLQIKTRFAVPARILITRLLDLEMISKKQKELFLSLLRPEDSGFKEPLPSMLKLTENQRIKEMILIGLKNDSTAEETLRIEAHLKKQGVSL